jgi:hypothetical protein
MFRLRFLMLVITTPILASAATDDASINLGSSNPQVQAYDSNTTPRSILVGPNSPIKRDNFIIGDQISFVSFVNQGADIRISNRLALKSPVNIQLTDASGSVFITNSSGVVATNGLSSINLSAIFSLANPINLVSVSSIIGNQTSFVSFLNEGGNITISNRLGLNSPVNIQLTDASGSLYIINSSGIVAMNGLVSISSPSTLSLPNPINLVSLGSVPEASTFELFTLGLVVLCLFTATVKVRNRSIKKCVNLTI